MKGYKKMVLSFFTAFMMLLFVGISTPFTVSVEGAVSNPTSWEDLTLNGDMILDLNNLNDLDAGGKTITVTGGSVTIKGDANKTFKNLSIIIKNGSIVAIENLNITNDSFNSAPIIADDGSDNTLIISGTNNIRSNVDGKPSISVGGLAKLLITSTETNSEINAYGGSSAAGIGGGSGSSGGIITIDGAKVTASGGGGFSAAGIGGGSGGSGGIITIDGNAEVTASGGEGFGAAGIGSGLGGSGGTLVIGKDVNLTAIRKSGSSSAINVTISSSQPIICGKVGAALSNTSDTNIQITDISNNSITKSFKFPAGAYSFSSTVGGAGEYTIDAGDKSLVKSGVPIDGIYNLTSSDLYEYDMTTCYKVTFDSQGGTPTFQYGFVTGGDKVSAPAYEPAKDGRAFEGWYKEPSYISKWDFDKDIVNANTTLYAKYPSQASGIIVSAIPKIQAEPEKVMLTVAPEPLDVNHEIYYRVLDTKPTKMYVGDLINIGEWTEVTDTSSFEINAADGKYVEVVEINVADNKVTKWGVSSEVNDGYTPSYEMNVSETGTLTLTFPDQVEGYSTVTPKSMTFTKTGNEDITNLAAVLTGADKDSFILGTLSTETLNNTTTEAAITVQPKDGLAAGSYTAIVNVSADKIENKSINVSFKVRPKESKPEIPAETLPATQPTPTLPSALATVTITGTERVGKTLEAVLLIDSRAEVTTTAAVTYKWYRLKDKASNSGELVGYDKTYKLDEIDKGRYIKVIAYYNGETFVAFTGKIDSSSKGSSSTSSSFHKKNSATNKSTSTKDSDANSIPVKISDGWQKKSDNIWKYGENGKAVVGWKQINNLWYFFDFNGIMQTGWKFINGSWYLLNDNGAMVTGWALVNGKWYYLTPSGSMTTGWALVNGKWYYLTPSGSMTTGWISLNEKWYYLNSSGAMETYWINLNGNWYYLYGDGSLAVNTNLSYRVDENGVWVG